MMISPLWRTRLTTIGAGLLALWLGAGLAEQEYFWPMLIAGALVLLVLRALLSIPIDELVLGLVLCGYLAGNRGFAQISLTNGFPLLPAEFALLIAGSMLAVQSAFRRELPLHREPLNLLILVWIFLGGVRLLFDVGAYGFTAIRDFAVVYYAAFFFLAQALTRGELSQRWLHGCLLAGCLGMAILYPLTELFPSFFFNTLVLRGNPIIYFKGDLVGTMLTAGAVLIFLRYETTRRIAATIASLALIGIALTTNNRSSLVGLVSVTLLLVIGFRWRFALTQLAAGFTAIVAILFFAYLTNISWRQTPLIGVYERVASLTDPLGQRTYSGKDTYYKGDNNRFRAVWWRTIFNETIDGNPWFGLGFGHDLAQRFVREYYPEQGEEFDTRSPHNVMLTVFARMGLAGLLPLLAITGLIARRIVRCARTHDPSLGMWGAAWVILVSACFGVVLEGPMGAVVFWIALGCASAAYLQRRERDRVTLEASDAAPLLVEGETVDSE